MVTSSSITKRCIRNGHRVLEMFSKKLLLALLLSLQFLDLHQGLGDGDFESLLFLVHVVHCTLMLF